MCCFSATLNVGDENETTCLTSKLDVIFGEQPLNFVNGFCYWWNTHLYKKIDRPALEPSAAGRQKQTMQAWYSF